jgi:hypothetical protein
MERFRVVGQVAHPSYVGVDSCPAAGLDVALLRLERPVPLVPPRVLATSPPSPGASCSAVGYGAHNLDSRRVQYGQKRRATERVVAVTAMNVEVEADSGVVDHGDSGGPLLCGRQIAGVTSCKSDGEWPRHSRALYARTDRLAGFIESTLAAWRRSPVPARSCTHDVCEVGAALEADCSACAESVCSRDDYCCTLRWDESCTSAAAVLCGSCR